MGGHIRLLQRVLGCALTKVAPCKLQCARAAVRSDVLPIAGSPPQRFAGAGADGVIFIAPVIGTPIGPTGMYTTV